MYDLLRARAATDVECRASEGSSSPNAHQQAITFRGQLRLSATQWWGAQQAIRATPSRTYHLQATREESMSLCPKRQELQPRLLFELCQLINPQERRQSMYGLTLRRRLTQVVYFVYEQERSYFFKSEGQVT